LNWQPEYDLISGLKDSFNRDYLLSNQQETDVDFSTDDQILSALPTQP
jgi:hypothetical protein